MLSLARISQPLIDYFAVDQQLHEKATNFLKLALSTTVTKEMSGENDQP